MTTMMKGAGLDKNEERWTRIAQKSMGSYKSLELLAHAFFLVPYIVFFICSVLLLPLSCSSASFFSLTLFSVLSFPLCIRFSYVLRLPFRSRVHRSGIRPPARFLPCALLSLAVLVYGRMNVLV